MDTPGAPRRVPYDRRFLDRSWEWLQDEELKALTMTPAFTREGQGVWFDGLRERTDYLVWGIEVDGTPIGAFGLKNIDPPRGEYWGYIGEREHWGRGVGRWMVEQVLDEARRLALGCVYLRVWSENQRALALYRRCGFEAVREADATITMERRL